MVPKRATLGYLFPMRSNQLRKPKAGHDAGDLLIEVIQREGLGTLGELLRKRAKGARDLPQTVQSFAGVAFKKLTGLYSEIREEGLSKASKRRAEVTLQQTQASLKKAKQLPATVKGSLVKAKESYQALSGPRERTEYLLSMGLYAASYLGGVYLGYQLPVRDLKLAKRSHPKSLITLYSAPLFTVELAVEWTKTMVQRALEHPQANDDDKKVLKAAERIFLNLSGGLAAGVAAGEVQTRIIPIARRKKAPLEISLHDDAYRAVEDLFTSIAERWSDEGSTSGA